MARRRMLTDEDIVARARPVFVDRGYRALTRQITAAVGLTWGAIALASGQGGRADLHGLAERLRTQVWERWPLRLQFRLAATGDGPDDEPDRVVKRLADALESHVRPGAIRSDMSREAVARVVLALLTGDVAQRFMARVIRAMSRSSMPPAASTSRCRCLVAPWSGRSRAAQASCAPGRSTCVRSTVHRRAAGAHHARTIFKPDLEALAALAAGVRERGFSLPVGLCAGFDQADLAFAHVATAGKPGRAVLQP